MAAKHSGGVADGLAAAQLGQRGVHDHRMATEFGNRGLEGDPGACRWLVEQHRDRARSSEGTEPIGLCSENVGEIQDVELLGGVEIVVNQEVSHVDSPATWSRRDGSLLTKLSSSAALMISAGARRRTSGRGALITNPASSAASTTAGAMGLTKITACSRPRPRTPVIIG